MNFFDAEMHLLRQKELTRHSAESYPLISHLDNGGVRLAYRRALAGVGSRLVILGFRLQGEIDQLTVVPEMTEPLGFGRNGNCAGC